MWALWARWNPWGTTTVPKLDAITTQLAFITNTVRMKQILHTVDLLLQPPVQQYGTLDFVQHLDIERIGYEFHLERLRAWKAAVLAENSVRSRALFGLPSSRRRMGIKRSKSFDFDE